LKRLRNFYYQTYRHTDDKTTIAQDIREQLYIFEDQVITMQLVFCEDLLLANYPAPVTKIALKVLHIDAQNKKRFYIRLLKFHLHYATAQNYNEDIFVAIRIYFRLQEYYSLKDENNIAITTLLPKPKGTDDIPFTTIRGNMQRYLNVILAKQRHPLRLHNKFMRAHAQSKAGSPSATLLQGMLNPKPGGITLDGLAARSVIIALHKMISQKNLALGKITTFNVGQTKIRWKDVFNHGVVQLEIGDATAFNKCAIPGIPYDKRVTDLLKILETKLKINLMQTILDNFCHAIKPFSRADYPALSVAEVNFLNGFAFLSQICEVARYLHFSQRDIENEPMSIALAIVKHLRVQNIHTWETLYANAPASFKQQQTNKKYVSGKGYVNDPSNQGLGGLDPASGKALKQNIPALRNKIAELDKLFPGYLGGITSARTMRTWLQDHYGNADESDPNDSPYSSDEDTYKPQRKDAFTAKFDVWTKIKKKEKKVVANPWQANNFLVHDVPGDGNCFFHAVIDQLTRIGQLNGANAATLRQRAIDHMLTHWEHYAPFCAGADAYIDQMVQDGEWSDHPIIQATAELLNINIDIHHDNGEHSNIGVDSAHTITLGYYVDAHYVSLTLEQVDDDDDI
jgi:hypothetical protein